jgi:hypothetical protein
MKFQVGRVVVGGVRRRVGCKGVGGRAGFEGKGDV